LKSGIAFAEIIESSLQNFLAQSWEWNEFPQFGSLVAVQTKKRTLFGLVYQIQTGSMDPTRYPFPYKKTQEQLLAEQPQIFQFLKTTFSCVLLGYSEKGKIFYGVPPEPGTIHSFVSIAESEVAKDFFYSDNYLPLLFAQSALITIGIDELLVALMRYQKELGILSPEKLNHAMGSFSLLTGNDYRRMKLLLQRVEHFC
jgi:hypothetical protein